VLVIYRVFATSEGIKRNISVRRRTAERPPVVHAGYRIANAGNGWLSPRRISALQFAAAMKDSLRPIPLLITPVQTTNTPTVVVYKVSRARRCRLR
jgi:hypothetical protein